MWKPFTEPGAKVCTLDADNYARKCTHAQIFQKVVTPQQHSDYM